MSAPEINAAVIGATGYVGGELLRLLSAHPHFTLCAAVSESRATEAIGAVFPYLAGACAGTAFAKPETWMDALERGSKLALFSAAPHGASAALVANALDAAARRNLVVHVVDCSADFRYAEAAQYEQIYKSAHAAPDLLGRFSCGLPEQVSGIESDHVGHPGCFTTAILLAIVPLAGLSSGPLFVTAVTGSTGSGKSAQAGTHHPERHSNLYAYKPLAHRHAPEMECLAERATGTAVSVQFVPHSGPFSRGIYATVQAQLRGGVPADSVLQAFDDYYAHAEFVRVIDGTPKLKDVIASNYCHIGVAAENGTVVVTSAIDNLVKGAAGGAVQWMNRLWSLPETCGLLAPATPWI
ncbi:MAG TPA: N-acetyl-gamma-glutamyl-phosphate reductase [Woeseiaceae bacterium]|nr:N-acetyl-gamma-glutamyl-phosphate reductase [Woeseiaceae bacterium]